MKKYELIKEPGSKLFRIRALRDFGNIKKGDLGGLVEGEHNLSHDGDCWIYNNAQVYGNAQVFGDAQVCDNAQVYEYAKVYGYVWILDNAHVYEYAHVYGLVSIYGNSKIYADAEVYSKKRCYIRDKEIYFDYCDDNFNSTQSNP